MPPRNSMTKAFRKYHYVSTGGSHIPLEKIYDNILKPEDCLDNAVKRDFDDYKNRMNNAGVDLQDHIQKIFKDDDDGDPRYVNQSWYKKKLEGE